MGDKKPSDGAKASEGAVVAHSPSSRGGIPIHYPQLTDTNYCLWAVKMKIILRSLRCWSAIEGEGEVDPTKDEDAFAALSQSVPDSIVMAIAEYNSAAEAWDAIRRMRVGEDRVKKANVKQLKRQLDRLEMEDRESITGFAQKLTTLVGEIRSLGEKISDESVIERLFSAVPDHFADVVNTIEQWGDLTTMSVAEAVGRLASHELNQRGHRRNGGGKDEQLMLVTKALEQLMKGKQAGEGAGTSGQWRSSP